jgi:hypothetical protein
VDVCPNDQTANFLFEKARSPRQLQTDVLHFAQCFRVEPAARIGGEALFKYFGRIKTTSPIRWADLGIEG